MEVRAQTISLQKYVVSHALKYTLTRIEKDPSGIELRLVLFPSYLIDDNMTNSLKKVLIE